MQSIRGEGVLKFGEGWVGSINPGSAEIPIEQRRDVLAEREFDQRLAVGPLEERRAIAAETVGECEQRVGGGKRR